MQEITENSFNTKTFPNSTEHALVTYNLSLLTMSAVQLVHSTSLVASMVFLYFILSAFLLCYV